MLTICSPRPGFIDCPTGRAAGCCYSAGARVVRVWPAAGELSSVLYLEPNILAHCRLVTTDFGVDMLCFRRCYFLWRPRVRLSVETCSVWPPFSHWRKPASFPPYCLVRWCSHAGRCCACQESLVRFALAIDGSVTVWKRLSAAAVIIAALALAAWVRSGAYDFRYLHLPHPTGAWIHKDPPHPPTHTHTDRVVAWVDEHHLLRTRTMKASCLDRSKPNGVARFLPGSYRLDGWWFLPFAS